MSSKGRIKFVVAGTHPLLQLVRDRLIHTGYALVPWSERPDFCLFGGSLSDGADLATELVSLSQQAQGIYGAGIPTILLTGGLIRPEQKPSSPLMASSTYQQAAEVLFAQNTKTLVLRVFDVYGPDITWGLVHKFILLARQGKPLPLYQHGYQTRTFLHQEDFFTHIDAFVSKFSTTQQAGIFDVSHPETHSIRRLADSVWQLTHGADVVTLVEPMKENPWDTWAPKDTDDTELFLGFKPQVTLRQGLWRILKP